MTNMMFKRRTQIFSYCDLVAFLPLYIIALPVYILASPIMLFIDMCENPEEGAKGKKD